MVRVPVSWPVVRGGEDDVDEAGGVGGEGAGAGWAAGGVGVGSARVKLPVVVGVERDDCGWR